MKTYSYDMNYDPPAPVAKIEISTNLAKQIGKDKDSSKKIEMLIDTGSDISLIPKNVVIELEKLLGTKLPYGLLTVDGFGGNKSIRKSYSLNIRFDGFNSLHIVDFIEIDGDIGILGRDVLNDYLICFDGKNLKWTISKD